jgi:DNA-directed RNA polymerase subunit beta'
VELRKYYLPAGANLEIKDGDKVDAGDILAKIPREAARTKDITGGLPRAEELFEARRPKNPAVISEIDGVVKFGGLVRGHRKLTVHNEKGGEKEYFIPKGAHLGVGEGERVKAGTPLMDGPVNPHDILKVLGEKELAEYLLREIQEVYRLQGVVINDKHIEIIIRQMLRWVKVEEVGDTELLVDEQIDKFVFQEENEKVVRNGGKPAKARPLLLGITKSALSTDSFIAAASFQETTRVLTEASLYGKVDYLRRLKENIIMGRLIPAGTGYRYYRDVELKEEVEAELKEEADLSVPS